MGIEKQKVVAARGIKDPLRKRLYTIEEAAGYLGRCPWGIRELIWKGKIPFIQDGRKYYLDIKDLDQYIEKQKVSCPES